MSLRNGWVLAVINPGTTSAGAGTRLTWVAQAGENLPETHIDHSRWAYDTPSTPPVSTVTEMMALGRSSAFLPPFVAFYVLSTGPDAVERSVGQSRFTRRATAASADVAT
jgi:hypothetical protein